MPVMSLDNMVCAGPLYLHRKNGQYRCVWSPLKDNGGIDIHGIGLADTPYIAVSRAYNNALSQGWKPPA